MSAPAGIITLIKDLKPGQQNVNLHAIVLEIGRANTVKDSQEVRTVKLADKSGSVNLSLWNEPGKVLMSGDIVRISKAYTSMFKSQLTVYLAKFTEFCKVSEFCMLFSETPNMSETNNEMAAQFEKDEIERKERKAAARDQSNKSGQSSGSRPISSSGGGEGSRKTWGTQSSTSNRGGSGQSRQQHRSSSKEKR